MVVTTAEVAHLDAGRHARSALRRDAADPRSARDPKPTDAIAIGDTYAATCPA
jgi:hypothetical protein